MPEKSTIEKAKEDLGEGKHGPLRHPARTPSRSGQAFRTTSRSEESLPAFAARSPPQRHPPL